MPCLSVPDSHPKMSWNKSVDKKKPFLMGLSQLRAYWTAQRVRVTIGSASRSITFTLTFFCSSFNSGRYKEFPVEISTVSKWCQYGYQIKLALSVLFCKLTKKAKKDSWHPWLKILLPWYSMTNTDAVLWSLHGTANVET